MDAVGPLAEIAIAATAAIVVGALLTAPLHPAVVNAVVLVSVGTSMMVYSLMMGISLFELPHFLWNIVFTSHSTRGAGNNCSFSFQSCIGLFYRNWLLFFWSMNVMASVSFGAFVTVQGRSSTVHRKFFHLTVSQIFVSGLFYDRDFIWLSGWLMLCIFIIIEGSSCRFSFLLMTSGLTSITWPGVAAVGIGDSVAAIVGSKYGTTRWPRSKKTVEGSSAMAAAIAVFLIAARPFCSSPVPSYPKIVLTALILAAIEAFTVKIDNIALPVVGYFLLS
ncbi:hypothetical protein OESDEN_06716 [Oesophagostomum dentatum]|uniref:dolichol kinase n=1 Tax=Oesophagostomum dentatum TaxID=61180 RepID=A0A0B1T729_OESDE|nr:hypothetical protein OESDEN_06716 [Oesophagostomum dentatum]